MKAKEHMERNEMRHEYDFDYSTAGTTAGFSRRGQTPSFLSPM
jgi:hypothetical protein